MKKPFELAQFSTAIEDFENVQERFDIRKANKFQVQRRAAMDVSESGVEGFGSTLYLSS